LIRDHRAVEALFDSYNAVSDPSYRRRIVNEIIRELSIHTVIEERYLYPLCREAIPEHNEGKKLAEHGLKEHRELKVLLDHLLYLDEHSPQFDITVQEVIKDCLHHHKDEERDIFPLLRTHVSHERLIRFGVDMDAAKRTAPTHPHPHAPDQPPVNTILAPLLHVMDKVLDTGRAFPGDGYEATTHTDLVKDVDALAPEKSSGTRWMAGGCLE